MKTSMTVASAIFASTLLFSTQASAENCSTSFFCYGNSNPQAATGISAAHIRVDESATGVTHNRVNVRANANPRAAQGCHNSKRTLMTKAGQLESLARKKQAERQPAQAQRLFNNARQLRANAARLNCR